MYRQIGIRRAVYGKGTSLLVCGSVTRLPKEIRALSGQVQCMYLDPPFMTGGSFRRRRPLGEKGWKRG